MEEEGGFGDFGGVQDDVGLFDDNIQDQAHDVDFLGEGDGSGEGESGGVGGGSGFGVWEVMGGSGASGERGTRSEQRITTKFMTKYEKARILGTRALQLRWV